MSNGLKSKVLFICATNSVRSQMAEAILRQYAPEHFEVFSAGLIKTAIHQLTPQILQKLEIPFTNHVQQTIQDYTNESFDYIITLDTSSRIHPRLPSSKAHLHWEIEMPQLLEEESIDRRDIFEGIAQQLQTYIRRWLKSQNLVSETEFRATMFGDYFSEVFVLHLNGAVLVNRQYSEDIYYQDSQLVGALLSAIITFAKSVSASLKTDEEKDHTPLRDIGLDKHRWFIHQADEFIAVMIIENNSVLNYKENWVHIPLIASKILTVFSLFREFNPTIDVMTSAMNDYSKEFGKTIDNIIFETIIELDKSIQYAESTEAENRIQRLSN